MLLNIIEYKAANGGTYYYIKSISVFRKMCAYKRKQKAIIITRVASCRMEYDVGTTYTIITIIFAIRL